MSSFEDHLWSQLVSDHGDQLRQAGKTTASLAASLGETGARRRWRGSRRQPSRRQLALAATTLGGACLAIAMVVALTRTSSPTGPTISPAAFAVTDNHDGTLTVALHKLSAIKALNASLARYDLKAKLPTDVSAKTVSLTATCPKAPTKPVRTGPAISPEPPGAPRVPPQFLRNCALH